jgi:hypothetical protein
MSLIEDLYTLQGEAAFLHGTSNVSVKHEVVGFVTKISYDQAQMPTVHHGRSGQCHCICKLSNKSVILADVAQVSGIVAVLRVKAARDPLLIRFVVLFVENIPVRRTRNNQLHRVFWKARQLGPGVAANDSLRVRPQDISANLC